MKIVFNPLTKYFSISSIPDLLNSLVKELNTWDYGVLIGDKEIIDLNGFDFESNYHTIPIDKLKKYKIGLCWDFVNYEHYILNKNSIPHDCYMIVGNDGHVTHTFVVVHDSNKHYWIESAYYKYKGVHEVNNVLDIVKKGFSYLKNFDIYKYNPDGLDKELNDKEFFNRATKDLIYTTRKMDSKSFSDSIEIKQLSYNDLMSHKKDPDWKPLGLIHTIYRDSCLYFIAFNDSEPAGILVIDNDNSEVLQLVTNPKFRNQGVARKLMESCGPKVLYVKETNPAREFYKKIGYKETGKRNGVMIEMKKIK